jgi:predicted XRE-type DNA-binding protein
MTYERNIEIWNLKQQGKSSREIAALVGISDSRVREIIRETALQKSTNAYMATMPLLLQRRVTTEIDEAPGSHEEIRHRERMTSFAKAFPCLENAEGIRPWDAEAFKFWVVEQEMLENEDWRQKGATGRFLLALWTPAGESFDLMQDIRFWDSTHRDSFRDWAKDPWWP